MFVLIASVTVAVPVLYYVSAGESAAARMEGWKAWLGRNNSTVMVVLLVLLGTKLIGSGLAGLWGA